MEIKALHQKSRFTARDRTVRWLVLGLCLAPILGSFLYNQGFSLFHGPCLFQRLVGFISPSCGLTRSFMAIARGDLGTALTFHAFGPVLYLVLVGTAAHLLVELVTEQSLSPWYIRLGRHPLWQAIWIGLFLAYYVLRLYARYGEGPLPFDLAKTVLWHHIQAGAYQL